MTLIDLSRGGAQIETTGHRLQPGSSIVIEFAAADNRSFAVPAQILRCQIAGLSPRVWYRSALLFKRPFDFPGASVPDDREDAVPGGSKLPVPATTGVLTPVGARALETAFAMIQSARGRDSAAPFTREMDRLLRLITKAVEDASGADVIAMEVVERVRRSLPLMVVRVIEADDAVRISDDAISFRVPSSSVQTAARLVVEFPQDCQLESWHLQLLEGAAQLIGVTRDLELAGENATQALEPAPEIPAAQDPKAVDLRGWHRLVVRHLDGRLFKGFGRDFQPTKGSIQLWSVPDGPAESMVMIPFAGLKAIFFVRDFDGDPAHVVQPSTDDQAQKPPAVGRRVTVTFVDGEVLRGTTMSYTQNGPGFFVSPIDSRTNNVKLFVVSGAIGHVQFR